MLVGLMWLSGQKAVTALMGDDDNSPDTVTSY